VTSVTLHKLHGLPNSFKYTAGLSTDGCLHSIHKSPLSVAEAVPSMQQLHPHAVLHSSHLFQ